MRFPGQKHEKLVVTIAKEELKTAYPSAGRTTINCKGKGVAAGFLPDVGADRSCLQGGGEEIGAAAHVELLGGRAGVGDDEDSFAVISVSLA